MAISKTAIARGNNTLVLLNKLPTKRLKGMPSTKQKAKCDTRANKKSLKKYFLYF